MSGPFVDRGEVAARKPRYPHRMTVRRKDDLIPRSVRQAVIEAVGGWGLYTVGQIGELFRAEDFESANEFQPATSGQRRQEAEAFQVEIDFRSSEQVERYLRVVEHILDDHLGDAPSNELTDDARKGRGDKLLRALQRAGVERDEKGRLRLPAHRDLGSLSMIDLPSESDIRLHMSRLSRLEQEPEEMIGAAKELVEATVKHVLLELEGAVPENQDLPGLSKQALSKLGLHPSAIAPTAKGAEIMKRILEGQARTAPGLAELRNLGYGTGHGQGRRVKGLKRRHAELAARSAITFSAFVLDTLHDEDAPWRKDT